MDCATRSRLRLRDSRSPRPLLSCKTIWNRNTTNKVFIEANVPTGRQIHVQCRADGTERGVEPRPEELMRMLAVEYGVRVYEAAGRSGRGDRDDDEDDEEESWEEVVSELGNPLDMRPARVGLMDDLNDDATLPPPPPGPPPAEPSPTAAATASGLEAPAAAAAASAAAPPAGPSVRNAYLDLASLIRITREELLDLLAGPAGARQQGDGSSNNSSSDSSSSNSSSSSPGGGVGVRPRVVLVDVREVGSPPPASSSPAPLPGVATLQLPLSGLRRAQAEQLEAAADYVVVLSTGDHRGEQAVVRLTKVYGLRRVVLYDEEPSSGRE